MNPSENSQPGQAMPPEGPELPASQTAPSAPVPVTSSQISENAPTQTPLAPQSPESPNSFYTAQPNQQPAILYSPPSPEPVPSPAPHPEQSQELSWTGAEFVAHDKGANWFTMLGLVGLVLAAVVYLLTKDKITTGIIVFTAIAFGIFAARKPREQNYALTENGIEIGRKHYGYHDFKSFSSADESGVSSMVFMPMKRFMPPLTIYVPRELEKQAAEFLIQFLPVEQHKADAVDRLLRRIHF